MLQKWLSENEVCDSPINLSMCAFVGHLLHIQFVTILKKYPESEAWPVFLFSGNVLFGCVLAKPGCAQTYILSFFFFSNFIVNFRMCT